MEKYNFIKDSKRELEAFYARFFDSDDELQTFLSDAFDYENGSLARRQALFQVQRFISLANDIDKIRPIEQKRGTVFGKKAGNSFCKKRGKPRIKRTGFPGRISGKPVCEFFRD